MYKYIYQACSSRVHCAFPERCKNFAKAHELLQRRSRQCNVLNIDLSFHHVHSGVAKLGHTGAHWGTCPSNWRLCPTSADAPENYRCRMSIANWALKVRKGVEIELRSIAICIFRITRSICFPDLNVCVCRKYYSYLTLRARRFVAKALSKCSNSRRRYGLK